MKILHTVEFYEPSQGGAQEVVKQLSERMAALGHDVTVATTKLSGRKSDLLHGVKIVDFDIHGNEVVGVHGEVDAYKQFLVNSNFDIMMNYAAQQWATDLAFEVLDQIKAKKIIVPCGYSALHNPDFEAYFKKLPDILRRYDASVYLTKQYQDYRFAKKYRVRHLHVIPNGADEREFLEPHTDVDFRKKYDIDDFLFLTISNHTGSKGHRETLQAFERFPYPGTLVIIGKSQNNGCIEECQNFAARLNKESDKKKVLLLTLSRAETVAALKTSDAFLFLSNIEASPIVLFEAAAAGLPFISADVGNAREIAKWTKGGLIVKVTPDQTREGNVLPDVNSALERMIKLYEGRRLRSRLGARARKAWLKHFTWAEINKQYLTLYEEVLR